MYKNEIVLILGCLIVYILNYGQGAPVDCARAWEKLGCYREHGNTGDKLFDDRDHMRIRWKDYSNYLRGFACECAEAAKISGYSHFGLQNWGICIGLNGTIEEKSNLCADGKFQPCADTNSDDCVGKADNEYIYILKPVVDGKWSSYGPWGSCSASCGDGSQMRRRSCSNPPPQNGGTECSGAAEETRKCNIKSCPVDGGLTQWVVWSTCDKSCGSGMKSRTRSCNNPSPSYGGADCVGELHETLACNTQACPVNGRWGIWHSYGPCSKSCGGGTHVRHRQCNNPPPKNGGNKCFGHSSETKACNNQPCPVHGGYSAFTGWSACTKPCGRGVQSRSRTCTNPRPAHGGLGCARLGPSRQVQPCNVHACPPRWPRWPHDFAWSSAGPIRGRACVQIAEIADPHTWLDNYFCWIQRPGWAHPGLRWSSAGAIRGMRCTRILEVADPHTWADNYLCVPHHSPYHFHWSSSHPVPGTHCIRWVESADPHTWNDNYLCARAV